ncbi:hypothetical protein [Pseudoxanthomonas mexicana]|uniref:hypothetical protein n=1 Tax=Pseudoxanthomonas mexicana TaxID=128785 RepID=UPI00398AA917
MKFLILLTAGIALAAIPAGSLASREADADLNVQAAPFQEQAARIRADLSGGNKYSEIKQNDRDNVLGLLRHMESQLAGVGSVDELSMQARVELFNTQEHINTILTGARADSRVICTREQVTGSHRKQQTCLTVAERERRREANKEHLLRQQRYTPCLEAGKNCASPGL